MAKHTTMRGLPINMAALVAQNAKKVALGNASKNARGDLVTRNGVVIKSQEQLEAERASRVAAQTTVLQADIKADSITIPQQDQQAMLGQGQAVKGNTEDFPTLQDLVEQGTIPPKRKIVEK